MISERLLKLPPWLVYEGITFTFQIFIESQEEIRVCYDIDSVDGKSPHLELFEKSGSWINPFNEDSLQGFLWLYEGITNDAELLLALTECRMFLTANHLI